MAHSAGTHALYKVFDDVERDVGVDQRQTNVCKRLVDIGLAERTAAA